MARPLNVALIGQKFMGRAHSNAYAQVGHFFDVPLQPVRHTIAARNAEELAAFAERWGWQHHTTNWQDIAANDAIELVDVATPNHLHAEASIAMLAAGKHVLCEKPLAHTLEAARTMRDAAAAAQGKTFVWFNYRRCPAVALAYQLVRDGLLGEIHHVRGHYLQSWGGAQTPMSWRFKKSIAGSGAHGDLNAHIVDMARFLTGDEVAEVSGAIAKTFVTERSLPDGSGTEECDVDDACLFLTKFAGGAVGSFEASRVAPGHENRNTLELNGSKGSLKFDFEDMNVLSVFDGGDAPATRGWKRVMCTSGEHHPYAGQWWPDAHVLGYEHGFVNMLADVLVALDGGQPVVPLPDFDDAYQTQRVLEAALISATRGAAVPLDEVE